MGPLSYMQSVDGNDMWRMTIVDTTKFLSVQ
jgi:hypothetical protein